MNADTDTDADGKVSGGALDQGPGWVNFTL